MTELSAWLAATSASEWAASNLWVVPLFQSIHILGVAVVLTSMLMLDLRLLGVTGGRYTIAWLAAQFLPWMWWWMLIMLTTGVVMILSDPVRALTNPLFQLKMLLLAVVLTITLVSSKVLRAFAGTWDETPNPPFRARLVGLVSLVMWVAIVVAGRFIAYV